MPLTYTQLDEIEKIHATLTKTFESGATRPLAYRRSQLLALARLAQENADSLIAAIHSDLGRHKLEVVLPEIGPIVSGAIAAAENLPEWTKPEKPSVEEWRSSWDATVYKDPKGIVAIIGPWNYPYVTTLLPLIGAIAAGCTAVVKPSEFTPTASQLLADLFPRYLDSKAYAIINGAESETTRLLDHKWDHIFFTGSGRVGRIVATAAAKNFTPTTLELGGKSPVVIDADHTDLEIAAKRTLWGKQQNAGQICVAPDYILVPRSKQDALVAAFQKAYATFWPHSGGALDPASELGRIMNAAHHARLQNLLKRTKGEVVVGGKVQDAERIEPTILKDVSLDDVLLEDEIFGPILPIVPVDDVDAAIRVIRERPTPLVLYVFTENEENKQNFVRSTTSGQLIFNDTFQQLAVYEIPFGGKGESGHGAYLGRHSFNTFVHNRGYVNVPLAAEPFLGFRYPPYTEQAFQVLGAAACMPIPDA